MTKNKLSDLNDHLFAEMERLSDEDLHGDALDHELRRATGMSRIAGRIIDNADLILKAQVAYNVPDSVDARMPKLLDVKEVIEHDQNEQKGTNRIP